MNQNHFAALTRVLSSVPSRRHLLRGLTGAGLGLGVVQLPHAAEAKKKRKHKKRKTKKPQPNAFGCLNVGQPCNGDSGACCSGICEGTPPKKGKQDTSRCVAHDTGGCVAGSTSTGCGGASIDCVTSLGESGVCATTTGNAGYCMAVPANYACQTDVDCQVVEGGLLGPRAACIRCADGIGGSLCASVAGSPV